MTLNGFVVTPHLGTDMQLSESVESPQIRMVRGEMVSRQQQAPHAPAGFVCEGGRKGCQIKEKEIADLFQEDIVMHQKLFYQYSEEVSKNTYWWESWEKHLRIFGMTALGVIATILNVFWPAHIWWVIVLWAIYQSVSDWIRQTCEKKLSDKNWAEEGANFCLEVEETINEALWKGEDISSDYKKLCLSIIAKYHGKLPKTFSTQERETAFSKERR